MPHVLMQDRMSTRNAAGIESSKRRALAQTQRELPAAIRSVFIVGVMFQHLLASCFFGKLKTNVHCNVSTIDWLIWMMFDCICGVWCVYRKQLLWRTCSTLRKRNSRDDGYRNLTSREKRPNYADNKTKKLTARWTHLTVIPVKTGQVYLNSTLNNTNCFKVALQ